MLEDTSACVLTDLPVGAHMQMLATPSHARGLSSMAFTGMPREESKGMSHASTKSRAMMVGGEPVSGRALIDILASRLLEGANSALARGDGLVFGKATCAWVAAAGAEPLGRCCLSCLL